MGKERKQVEEKLIRLESRWKRNDRETEEHKTGPIKNVEEEAKVEVEEV